MAVQLVPAADAVSALWIGLLTLANVRDRRAEIGPLLAVGLRGPPDNENPSQSDVPVLVPHTI